MDYDFEKYSTKQYALAKYLEVPVDEIDVLDEDRLYGLGEQEYLVLEDYEADEEWDDQLEDYIDDLILPEIPEHYRNYFDRERWKDDARYDGRGHVLALYDGCEEEIEIEDETYYIYRVN